AKPLTTPRRRFRAGRRPRIACRVTHVCRGARRRPPPHLYPRRMQSWSDTPIPTVPGAGPPLRLYDTADRQVRPVTAAATATMYFSSMTLYVATRHRQGATCRSFYLINRSWRAGGHQMHHVQNGTGVDHSL